MEEHISFVTWTVCARHSGLCGIFREFANGKMTSRRSFIFLLLKISKAQPQAVETQSGHKQDEHICHSFQERRGRERHPRDLREARWADRGGESFRKPLSDQINSVTERPSVQSLSDGHT